MAARYETVTPNAVFDVYGYRFLLASTSEWAMNSVGQDFVCFRAFPLRLGLLPGREDEVPEEHRRLIQRMKFGPKNLINIDYFATGWCARPNQGSWCQGTAA